MRNSLVVSLALCLLPLAGTASAAKKWTDMSRSSVFGREAVKGYNKHAGRTIGPRDKLSPPPSLTREFRRRTGYPQGREGHVIDYVLPPERGGTHTPDNLTWKPKGQYLRGLGGSR